MHLPGHDSVHVRACRLPEVAAQVLFRRQTIGLCKRVTQTYRPAHDPEKEAKIHIGYHLQDLPMYGVNIYHKGRLIENYKRFVLNNVPCVGILVVVRSDLDALLVVPASAGGPGSDRLCGIRPTIHWSSRDEAPWVVGDGREIKQAA